MAQNHAAGGRERCGHQAAHPRVEMWLDEFRGAICEAEPACPRGECHPFAFLPAADLTRNGKPPLLLRLTTHKEFPEHGYIIIKRSAGLLDNNALLEEASLVG